MMAKRDWTGKSLLAEVRSELKKRNECPCHHITVDMDVYKFGSKIPCANCGYGFRLSDYGLYRAGYVAGGGDEENIYRVINETSPDVHSQKDGS